MRALLVALILFASPVLALDPADMLDDPVLEARAQAISGELRCLVCQNQSIADSDADLAGELRRIVRERLVKGDSDEAVRAYVVARYGEFVLLNPVFGWHTVLLWIAAPALLVSGALILVFRGRRRSRTPEDVPLTATEQAALDRLTDN